MEYSKLMELAIEAREHAYSPYSGFKVGAALLTKNGKVYQGCNIENESFGATNCAERTALFKAVYEGEREFEAIAIVGGAEELIFCPPCGICRQALMEFVKDDFKVLLGTSAQDFKAFNFSEVLPLRTTVKEAIDEK